MTMIGRQFLFPMVLTVFLFGGKWVLETMFSMISIFAMLD